VLFSRSSLLRFVSAAGAATLSSCGERDTNEASIFSSASQFSAQNKNLGGAPSLTASEKSDYRQTKSRWWENLPKPGGVSEEKEPGRYYFTGLVTFKLDHRIVQGRAKSFVWENGTITIGGVHASGSPYRFSLIPDLSNSKMSSVVVGD